VTLFDPAEDPGPRRVTLARLAGLIAQAAGSVGRFSVEGEVHRPQTGRTGRQRFTLRDRVSQITVSVPAARRARCRIVAGERVAVTGRLEWVADWGQLQLVAEEVLPVGDGAIAALIAETRARLDADGLLQRRRRAIPLLPAAIGVVCGHEAAVRADIESVVAVRFPHYPVEFRETTVSGPGAVDHLIAAIVDLDARADIDVIILARGGGDATALLPFSDEDLCRAVCATRAPVVAAIGHEGDRPLVDEVADLRSGTPSLAAAAVVPDHDELATLLERSAQAAGALARGRVERAAGRLARVDRDLAVAAAIERAGTRLARASAARALVAPARELARAGQRLGGIDWRGPVRRRLDGAVRELTGRQAAIEALSPERVLERGYAVVRRADDRRVVRDPDEARPGQTLDIRVAGGSLTAVVR